MIDKKVIKKIKKGDNVALCGAISDLLDLYESDTFDEGYNAAMEEMGIYAPRLAVRLYNEAKIQGKVAKHTKGKDEFYLLDLEETEQIIKDFFNEIIEDNGK
jgi:hypothetical protein